MRESCSPGEIVPAKVDREEADFLGWFFFGLATGLQDSWR